MIRQTVLHSIRQYKLISAHQEVLVGVSGGADSLVLLHVLRQLQRELSITLHVATLDHGLRGLEGQEDVMFVEQICHNWSLSLTKHHIDVRERAAELRTGIEEAGRIARYDFFASVAAEIGASTVAVGHQANDQAETVLMHILRGSGIRGLTGMAMCSAVPGHPELNLIRPLLQITRKEIEAYCREHDLTPREDGTNTDTLYLRNLIRFKTLPHLRELNPQVDRLLAQMADVLRVEEDYMRLQFQQVVAPYVRYSDRRVTIERNIFQSLHESLKRRFILDAVANVAGQSDFPGYQSVNAAIRIAQEGKVGALADLTKAARLRIDYTQIVIENVEEALPVHDYYLLVTNDEVSVKIDQKNPPQISGKKVYISSKAIGKDEARLFIPEGAELTLRTRLPGDRFKPVGMRGRSRKLKNWMIDRKIPRYLRDRIPLLVVDNEIAAALLKDRWIVAEPFAHPKIHFKQIFVKLL